MTHWKGGAVPLACIATALVALAATLPLSASTDERFCGPMDVAFLIDDTGSMGGAIANVAAEAAAIIDDIDDASGGDFQLALLTFKDDVTVHEDLAAGNAAAVEADIIGLFASGGLGTPEASDEALNTAIHGLDAADRPPGLQTGDFDGTWRDEAKKIIILITDAPPGGFDDAYTLGVDDVNAHARALDAVAAEIFISAVFVPTFGDTHGQAAIMMDYAATTGGVYRETSPDGTSTRGAIAAIIDACGSRNTPPDCSGAEPSVAVLWPPNHRLVPISILGVTDADGDEVNVTITSIHQDEPVNSKGDGATPADGTGVGTDTAQVRAERAGTPRAPGDGRVYHVAFVADDGAGGTCHGEVLVGVPHDQRGAPAVDGGPLYDSTVP